MKLLPEMLARYVRTDASPEEIGERLTMLGFELEEILLVEGEPVLDVNIMANRGDAASVLGLARELATKVGAPTERLLRANDPALRTGGIESDRIALASPLVSRFALLDVPEVRNGESPEWLRRELIRMGQRPISLLVDLTNWVMFEVGQPMHAYDADRLTTGRFTVREARAGETLRLLSGAEIELQGGELLVAEGDLEGRPVALAGVMGGAETEVGPSTRRAVIEAARFDARAVRRARKAHGLFTEASYRFEREVDPELIPLAFARFAEGYREATGIELDANGFADARVPAISRPAIRLRPERASRLLGWTVTASEAEEILARLGFVVQRASGTLTAVPPSWRFDVESETDLVEEIGRVAGYERIPAALPAGTTTAGGVHGFERWRDGLVAAAIADGFAQTVGHSLVAGGDLMRPGVEEIGPRVVASPEHRVLRSSLWVSLAMSARRNLGRETHLFEMGRVFRREGGSLVERNELGLLSAGPMNEPSIGADESVTFFTIKGSVERLLHAMGIAPDSLVFEEGSDPRLHPSRRARIVVAGEAIGDFGQVHPDVARSEGLPKETLLADFDLDAAWLAPRAESGFRAFSRHPAIRRDLAILVSRETPYAGLESAIRRAAGELLERMWVFDLYEGEKIPAGTKSIGVAVVLRKEDGTFTDEEANRVRDEIERELGSVGATLRVG